eukprot:GILJ01011366.1.p1 GENE.GILJ01011366.1~~GILJ01011366.1.p1  ORF type:complete len:207 (-),score=33.49 GILJ01011366.1:352-921(-)
MAEVKEFSARLRQLNRHLSDLEYQKRQVEDICSRHKAELEDKREAIRESARRRLERVENEERAMMRQVQVELDRIQMEMERGVSRLSALWSNIQQASSPSSMPPTAPTQTIIAASTGVSSPQQDNPSTSTSSKCIICLEQPATHIFSPCGHRSLCAADAESYLLHRDSAEYAVCPIDRGPWKDIIRVFD